MKRLLFCNLVLAALTPVVFAQESSEPVSSEGEVIEIIQTPPPVDPTPVPAQPIEIDLTPVKRPSIPDEPVAIPEDSGTAPKTEITAPAPALEPVKPAKPAGPHRLKFPAVDNVLLDPPLPPHKTGKTPQSSGDTTGDVYIAHRSVVEKYNGWGWVKHESESWNAAQWVAVREKLGEVILPGRHLKHPNNDDGMQYRFYGEFSGETAYEPNKDVFIAVFNLKGFEVIGPARKPSGASLPKKTTGATRSKPTTGGARNNPFKR